MGIDRLCKAFPQCNLRPWRALLVRQLREAETIFEGTICIVAFAGPVGKGKRGPLFKRVVKAGTYHKPKAIFQARKAVVHAPSTVPPLYGKDYLRGIRISVRHSGFSTPARVRRAIDRAGTAPPSVSLV
ncbi:uncharacterized protein MCYG_00857 [Microsporum canis CBS 113480]|uniref:Uncharacterized protein n=1 Tax=Arthroderma otae (strain ATCC MYA-4605 / CBS 113480) TaxID=554155 RepID=C5FDJ5_ARTOC|nr:uncharacterized protein MCYG_00857 [Microsporum canis CBS 113480]EEQ27969.1 predicted protein [Microsporum canis CBS 113480]